MIFLTGVIILIFLPLSIITAQEKKIEKKIKVIISDDSDVRVITDTTISDDCYVRYSVKPGKDRVVFIGKGKNDEDKRIVQIPEGREIIIKSTTGNDGGRKCEKEITVISSDSINWIEEAVDSIDGSGVYYFSRQGNGKQGQRFVIISDDEMEDLSESEYDTESSDTDKTRYVIAKDGIVVSIEGEDESKVQEIASGIEKSLVVNKDEDGSGNEENLINKRSSKSK